jgi:preprotein translocase subunit SecA
LEYDDVLNRHREVIYGMRYQILKSYKEEKDRLAGVIGTVENTANTGAVEPVVTTGEAALRQRIFQMIENEIEQLVSFHTNAEDKSEWQLQEIYQTAATIFPFNPDQKEQLLKFGSWGKEKLEAVEERTRIITYLTDLAKQKYEELLVKKAGKAEFVLEIEKQMLLRSIDNLWVEHLVAVDYLRTGIGLRGYGQRDPLVEYKKETYRMFNELLSLIQKEVVYTIFKVSIGIELAPSIMETGALQFQGAEKTMGGEVASAVNREPKNEDGETVGRNDLCFCGSGVKYKRCGMVNSAEHQRHLASKK